MFFVLPGYLSTLAFITLLEAHTNYFKHVMHRALPLEHRLATRRSFTRRLRLDSWKPYLYWSKNADTGVHESSKDNSLIVLQFRIISEEVRSSSCHWEL